MVEREIKIDLFDESAPENESLARLLDDGLWQELISKAERIEPPKVLEEDRGFAMDGSQRKEPSAGQEEDAADPLAALVQELIEGV